MKRILTTTFLLLALAAGAAPVSVDQAKAAVGRWIRSDAALGCRLGASVADARTCTADGASFHVVRLAGGGFVVTSADTRIEPVLAFSDSGDLAEGDANPLWSLLKGDLAARAKSVSARAALQSVGPGGGSKTAAEARWAKLLDGAALQAATTLSDPRVDPLVQSRWGQGQNSIYSNVGAPCYNYYTPSNYYCGCVATVLAQLMRYHAHPASAPVVTRTCKVDGVEQTFATMGGTYDWAGMPLVPEAYSRAPGYAGGATEAQRQAIGRVTYDCGVAMQMNWKSAGSGSGGAAAHGPLKEVFGYADAHTTTAGLDDAEYRTRILRTNLDAGLPVMLGITGPNGGHEVIADGYGYSAGVLYTHLNLGWSGSDDAWYALPGIDASTSFNALTHAVFNVNPRASGEIVSGRVTGPDGAPVAGAVVTLASNGGVVETRATDARGIYAFVVPSPSALGTAGYRVQASLGGQSSQIETPVVRATADSNVILGIGYYSYYEGAATPTCGNALCDDLVISDLPVVDPPVFTPPGCLFYPETNVVLACATQGAVVRYTLDGTDPDETSPAYAAPLRLTATTTVKARAFLAGANPSATSMAVYTFDQAQAAPPGDYFARPIEIEGARGECRVPDNAAYTLEDGEPYHTETADLYYGQAHSIWFRWTAPGSGTMTLTSACNVVTTNRTTVSRRNFSNMVAVYRGDALGACERIAMGYSANGGTSTLTFQAEEGETYRIVGAVMDESYVGAFTLTWAGDLVAAPPPAPAETSGTEVPVPHAWLDLCFPAPAARSAAEYEALAREDADGDGFATWEEYLCGTDPAQRGDVPRCTIRVVGGRPEVAHNVVLPEAAAALGWRAVLKGSADLSDWFEAPDPTRAARFFKIVVEKH